MSTPEIVLDTEKEPLRRLTIADCEVVLLGTAHVSQASADKVQELLREEHFDAVAVELCPSRHRAIVDPDALARMDLFKVIREGRASMVAASLALGAFQQRAAKQLGIKPGAEMHAAIEAARERQLPVLLIDREIGVTLKRVYRNVSWWQRLQIMSGLIASVLSRHEVSEADIERLKEGDILESTFAQFSEQARDLYIPLVDERDRYMAAGILQEVTKGSLRRVLVVIGAGHLKGIERYLRERPADSQPERVIAELDTIPPPSVWPRLIGWGIIALIVGGFVLGFMQSPQLGWSLVIDWVLLCGGLGALGTLLAAGHPLTIAGAFVAAPLTVLNPAVGIGMVTAAIEAYVRRPTVGDFSRLRQETMRWQGWWRNRVARVLLVFLFSTLGTATGTYVAGFRIYERLTG